MRVAAQAVSRRPCGDGGAAEVAPLVALLTGASPPREPRPTGERGRQRGDWGGSVSEREGSQCVE